MRTSGYYSKLAVNMHEDVRAYFSDQVSQSNRKLKFREKHLYLKKQFIATITLSIDILPMFENTG